MISRVASPIRVVLVDDSDDLRFLVRLALDREPEARHFVTKPDRASFPRRARDSQ